MANDDENWRKFDLLLNNFLAIGKSQSNFVNALALFLCSVWVVDLLRSSGGIEVSLLGAKVQVQGFWHIVPLVSGILSLGLIGSINIIHHAWRRLDFQIQEVFSDPVFFFTELDRNKNILDYLAFLKPSLRKPVLPDTPDTAELSQRWSPILLLYPSLILLSVFTTFFALRRAEVTSWFVAYVSLSGMLQSIFSLPFIWRKACLFTGVQCCPIISGTVATG